MKVVYLIGNGFDLAQGLNTRYSDFFQTRFSSLKIGNGILKKMQESVNSDIESWANMEKKLGEFTSEMNGLEDLDTVYDFIRKELRGYLLEEQERLTIQPGEAIFNRSILTSPEKYLLPESADAIQSLIRSLTTSNKNCEIDIISFNYTNVVERAFGYSGKPIQLDKMNSDINAKLNAIYKVHGSLEKEIIMGVADATQIANKQLAADLDALDVIVKPNTTALRRDRLCANCKRIISQADIIVMYGLSIGDTDKNWWADVTHRIGTNVNARLIIYSHPKTGLNPLDYPRVRREERLIYRKLYECNGQNNIKFTRLDNQIFISINDGLFQGIMHINNES